MSELIRRATEAVLAEMDITDGLDAAAAEKYVRAVIRAIRNPTPEMTEAGVIGFERGNPDQNIWPSGAHDVWRAMVDVVLR